MGFPSTGLLIAALALAGSAPAGGERGYALWNAASTIQPGAQVAVKEGEYVDRAALLPMAAIRTLEALVDLDKNKVILPADGTLALMSGGRAGEYCTWNHGAKLGRFRLSPTPMGGLLCLSVDASDRTTGLHYISGSRAALLREYAHDFAGGAKRVNSVKVERIAPAQYPADVEMGVVALVRRMKGEKRACLQEASGAVGASPVVFGVAVTCFAAPGATIGTATGSYTLISFDAKAKTFAIRVDRPINARGFQPRILD
jgi:hypothetical protein